jgi:anaerobic ribonucleoside-triphosphate reductase activating protein
VDTWDRAAGETTVARVLEAISPWMGEADGITVTGGEPLQQAAALERLLDGIRRLAGKERDVLVYSGFAWEKISARVRRWNGLADALIAGPFDSAAGQTLLWRGSDNQTLHPLTPLGREIYNNFADAPRESIPRALDVCFQGEEIWMAGIPDADTLATIRAELAASGFISADSRQALPLFP